MRGPRYYVFRGKYSDGMDIDSLIEGFDGIIFTICECGDVLCKKDGLLYHLCGCKTRPGHVRKVLNSKCELCMLKSFGDLR